MNQVNLNGIAADLLHGLDSDDPVVITHHNKIVEALRSGNLEEALKLAGAYPNTISWMKPLLTNDQAPT